ncbi:MAG: sugar transferase [Armatimonadota bacterium]
MVKRIFDVCVSLSLLLVLLPFLFIVAGLVAVSMGFPVLFCQERPGLNGKIFKMYKFRSMRNLLDSKGNLLPGVKRLTRLGKLLRATSVDELPELFNVLKGDMSLVGPRPLLVEYLPLYSPHQARRHEVRPGISGWAQVNGRNALSWEEKFDLDVWYVDNHSFWLDIKILFMTVVKVFKREGISHAADATMPIFTGSTGTSREKVEH